MYDKWEARRAINNNSAYRKANEQWRDHHQRFVRRARATSLLCQECGGRGDWHEDTIAGYALRVACEWCEGTGRMLPWHRGLWLRLKREEKRLERGKSYASSS